MIASLPMYDLPELAAATENFWRGLRAHMREAGLAEAPATLTRPRDLDRHWRDSALVFSQTCGYPLTHNLAGALLPIATPIYDAPGCEETSYSSVFVVRAEEAARDLADLAGRRIAYNATDSQSGYHVLAYELARRRLFWRDFSRLSESGAHRRSLHLVKSGAADLCAVDCVSWALIGDVAPEECAGLRVIGRSALAPALPFVTSAAGGAARIEALRRALAAALADPALAESCRALRLRGAKSLDVSAYEAILDQERFVATAMAA